MPDINTLPPSRSSSGSPSRLRHDSNPADPSSRSPSVSLAAAATINASMHTQDSRQSPSSSTSRSRGGGSSPQAGRHERRRSAVLLNLNLNDPTLPGPGELQGSEHRTSAFRAASPQSTSPPYPTADPHHQRAPSLGELHQELEAEQEAQVNRLLQMIRQQQHQLRQMQQATGQVPLDPTGTAIDDSTPTSERSFSFPTLSQPPASVTNPRPRSPAGQHRSSQDLSRQSSRRSRNPSRTTSPALGPVSAGPGAHPDGTEPWTLGGSRDESAFYQAETQTLMRENQMLRMRIRELGKSHRDRQAEDMLMGWPERQAHEGNPTASITSSPPIVSNLAAPPLSQEDLSRVGETSGRGDDGKP
ncbi:MAG: hypothetical protein M1833_000514 [Piccolia ochrophora]|nr:MAG: hypothetical protein M1833_000514 [Piccolia ochrophora]